MANDLWARVCVAATTAFVVSSIISAPSAAADDSVCTTVGQYCGFYSPSRNISCEINTGGRVGEDGVYCQTDDPPQSVTLATDGTFKSCTGMTCLGNAAPGIPMLAYGKTMALGQFKCLSEESGVTCTTGGRGFTISRSGIATAG
ncbi:hypothetical protein [Mycolicibacterium sp. P1-5]|uniref:hypothetical protein n=1 Tax=Mycolicibacterium sp. P1-5 TaxID=2024617 RepID=UPI0011EEDDA3|nr:hypothetical protein [Mycolicibacterium sp. P1-5]KAA0106122.1 hypothetical protein CIW47_19030 [Mycolicibacterium sp. P1-5]